MSDDLPRAHIRVTDYDGLVVIQWRNSLGALHDIPLQPMRAFELATELNQAAGRVTGVAP